MSVRTAGRGEVSQFDGKRPAVIVAAAGVVDEASNRWSHERKSDEQHTDANGEHKRALHGAPPVCERDQVWERGCVQVCCYAKGLFFISRKHRPQLATLAYWPSRRPYFTLHSGLRS